MSSRALRKLQQEKAKAAQAEHKSQDGETSDEDELDRPTAKPSAFAMLAEIEEDDNDDDEADHPDTEDSDQGVAINSATHATSNTTPSVTKESGAKKKKKKKKKGKLKTEQDSSKSLGEENKAVVEVDSLDEIDRALQSLATDGRTHNGATTAGTNPSATAANKLFAIDTTHLHAQNEMKRLFGRTALEQEEAQDVQGNVGGNRRQQRRMQHGGLAQALRGQGGLGGRSSGLASVALRRNPFIQGKTEWPMATGGGLGMEIEEKCSDGTVLYRFFHNRIYQDVQAQFDIAVESMDPNRLVVLLQHNPYHISTLLQVSEIAKQERDHATSGDLLERALFSFGRAVHSTFVKNLSEGNARLDFARPENREFWLASWRYMQNLAMRATWRTVYEWTKLLLSLSPQEDPYALWLVVDQYALRARQDLDFLNVSRDSSTQKTHNGMPSIQFSQSLAESRAGNKSKGQQGLFTAIGRFPWFAARLMQELAIDPPPSVWGKQPSSEKERLYAELYAVRAKDLWNTPEMIALLQETASAVPPETPEAAVIANEITLEEARHVILSDIPALISLIPRKYTTAVGSTSDPLPPRRSKISYTRPEGGRPSNVRHVVSNGSEEGDMRELQSLMNFFAGIFRRHNPGGEGGAGENGEPGDVAEEAIERAIHESGIPEEELIERAHRMNALRDRYLHGHDHDHDHNAEEENGQQRETERQARVEDAGDDDDDDEI